MSYSYVPRNTEVERSMDWRALQGDDHWKGLLEPLDLSLRKHVITYGNHAQAAYDAFISDQHSKYAGYCRYSKETLLEKVGVGKAYPKFGYNITKYLYATTSVPMPLAFMVRSISKDPWNKESNWMGYVSVTTDESTVTNGRRDITVAWRGTIDSVEWVADLDFTLTGVTPLLPSSTVVDTDTDRLARQEATVHRGWLSMYTSDNAKSVFNKTSARQQVIREVRRLLEFYAFEGPNVSITVTGHSLGAALSTLCAFDLVANGVNKLNDAITVPVTAIVFASPKVGNDAFRTVFEKMPALRILRVFNAPDLVPLYPVLRYVHVGDELDIDTRKSTYVKNSGNASCWHNLEGYLHGVAGSGGKSGAFELKVARDVALVNKSMGWLKDEYLVPESWWVVENKGMVQGFDGRWSLADPAPPDDAP